MSGKKQKEEKTIQELLEFGIINLDKPAGPTSYGADEIVKDMLGLRKVCHFGTLDPKVTGVLPLGLNRACKLLRWFSKRKKKYVGVMKIHQKLPLQKVAKESKLKLTAEKYLQKEMKDFIGKIMQKPPVKSKVRRVEREREVYSWGLLEYDSEERIALFETEVEAGTYIRKLIHDLGENIGGAHMLELRRTKAGIFNEEDEDFVNMYELEKAINEYKKGNERELRKIIMPAEEAIEKVLPRVQAKEDNEIIDSLLNGKPLFEKDILDTDEIDKIQGDFALFCLDKLIGVYTKVDEGEIIARAGFVFN